MIPRTDIFALDMNMSISEVIEELSEDLRYSRVPVYEENVDNIKGIVYIKDILLSKKDKKTRIRNLMKEAYFVPETKRINELFDELRKHRRQIAIVVDEYGGTSGIVTIEDILEEIVGEIYDEYDEVEKTVEKIDETTYLLNGNIAIYEVEDYLNISIEEGEYDTLSGYLVEKLGRIPNEKDKGKLIETEKVIYKLEKIEDKHIEKVKACIIEKPEEEEISEE